MKFVLITAARNEERTIEHTIQSVLAQSVVPKKWIIVSDASTDMTDAIIVKYAGANSPITHVRMPANLQPSFAAKVRCLNAGHKLIGDIDYDYIGILDADITLPHDYFECLMRHMASDSRLGIVGGTLFEEKAGVFRPRQGNTPRSVPGAIQFFRRACFSAIGGLTPIEEGGEDWIAEVMARANGYEVRSIPNTRAYHHRQTGTGRGTTILRANRRAGRMAYMVGCDPIFQCFRCLLRLRNQPYLVAGILQFLGFFEACFSAPRRPVTSQIVKVIRAEQRQRLRGVLKRSFRVVF